MFDIQHYTSFVAAILVFQLILGAGTIAILNATARNGHAAGFAAVAGTLAGDFVFMLAAVAGLAAVMAAHPQLFRALQWAGAAYLVWMGIQLLRARIESTERAEPHRHPWVYFRQAFAVSITNPKVVLFFVSFFPLFLKPEASTLTLMAMMLHVTALSLLYQTMLVLLGNGLAVRMRGLPFARRLATRLAGVALVGFGLKLARDIR
ncbi:MAG: threonine transporter [Candidatus Dactylopiibacterium carminicum]|uniref:LysE family translocator n=1 Tax=Candidatus Dactylopiibacterium carminicum TaxID=857335 RepID=A0A272EN09_9RHOO|nr:LysE family translocator [Candidatus Dactylopiibacterium carminicum]KAF7597930.1 LysE family translocator [Candidatus Dactylopiibacterium carminicum]PAS91504.1 MAG: threonine transporter [Candidatus Dactylopiibacterium carminicum]PAS93050.1 MAG: threonine transporter [Candidatus Dactylopiibacterium carminicum]PAS96030.1 MAG: threonine transporter [Candidatus Dactylopiibacterium carminicum]